MLNLAKFNWQRDPNNPILPPGLAGTYDCRGCMNPFVLRVGSEYRLYYSGVDADGYHRICLATAPVAEATSFTRHGVVLDVGGADDFDGRWCVVPLVHRFGDTWHLYYTGRHRRTGLGLQSFTGIGLATSSDGIHFTRYGHNPVITGDQTVEFPRNRGVAGGGTILEDAQADGTTHYRMYYTLAVGRPSDDVRVDQEKHCAVCRSADGIGWKGHHVILHPRRSVPSEDIAVAAPFVWREPGGYRMIYCGIGTRWGYYSMSQAVSEDGYKWHRGDGDENLTLTPGPAGSWEEQMVEYPSVIREKDKLRLFYCGNGYGATGIGTATAPLPE